MTCKDIIEKYLIDNGFDGLCGDECGCSMDDFMPCEGLCGDCFPAYEYEIKQGKTCKDCACDCPFGSDLSDYDCIYYPEDLPIKCRVNEKSN
jgi:hypothetical protein